MDYRGGAELQGETEGVGQLPRVPGITDKGITGYALPNLERRGKVSYSTVRRRIRQGLRSQDLPDVVTDKVRAEALPS